MNTVKKTIVRVGRFALAAAILAAVISPALNAAEFPKVGEKAP